MRIDTKMVDLMLAKKLMSKTDLSKKCGVMSQNIVAVLKRGTCEPKTLGKIAAALEIDVEQLIAKEE